MNDNIIALFLELVRNHLNLAFLCPQTIPLLHRVGWTRVEQFFASTRRNRKRSTHRPYKEGEPAIAIPCFINNNHWVAVVRREIQGGVLFLYSDDMHCPSTELTLRSLLRHHTDTTFYPRHTQWINCHSQTYIPNSIECGPRTLLALTIMMLHPACKYTNAYDAP